MSPFIASIETYDHGTFTYGFHLGTDERVARGVCEGLLQLRYRHATVEGGSYCPIRVRTVGLMRDGQLIDTFDGDWSSDMLDRMYAEQLEFDARCHAAVF